MENDGQERVDGVDEGSVPRSTEKIVLRDYDRIQERTPFQLKPVHLKVATITVVALVGLALFAGWLIGRSGNAPEVVRKVDLSPAIAADAKDADVVAGKTIPAGDAVAKTTSGRSVTGSILPLPSPQPRGPVDAPSERRPAVTVIEPEPPPPPEFVDWSLWPGLLITACDFSCLSADGDCRPEDRPVVEPATSLPEVPPENVETAPEVAEPSPAIAEPVIDVRENTPDVTKTAPTETKPPVEVVQNRTDAAKPKTDPALQKPAPKPVEARPKAVTDTPKKEIKQPEAPPRKFTVQIRSFKDEAAAKEFADQISGKGYNAFIVSFTDPSGTTWFRVRTGSFENAADAAEFAAGLNAKESEQAIPMEVK